MPDGVPNFEPIRSFPTIKALCESIKDGRKNMRAVLFNMVKNLSESINVVRNLTEDQMIEIASLLLDECGDFRLEDYQMMFTLAKRNKLVKFRDRIDITIVSEMLDEYWLLRKKEGDRILAEKEDLAVAKRIEQREQKMLSAPAGSIVELPPDYFAKELKRMQDENEERRQQDWADYIGRSAERKQKYKEQMAAAYGLTMEQLETLIVPESEAKITYQTFPSKINEEKVNENS